MLILVLYMVKKKKESMVTCMVICSIFLFSTLNYAEYLQKKKTTVKCGIIIWSQY